MNRRDFLKTGALLAAGLRSGPIAAQQPPPRKVTSVIWLWVDGDPSPFETWDPKPDGPAASIETNVEGIRIAETLPRCARIMDRLSIVRTVQHSGKSAIESTTLMHAGQYPSCWDSDVAVGTLLAFELWKRGSGSPPFIAIDAPPIPESLIMGESFVPYYLRGSAPEFRGGPGPEAWKLLQSQDDAWGAEHRQRAVKVQRERRTAAAEWLRSGMADAMDLSREPEELRKSYGAGFGQQVLLARRLIQAGTAVVEVGLNGWDAEPRKRCADLDAALSALIRDLVDKNLLKDTVVFVASRAGRQAGKPSAQGFSVVLAGGHLVGGRVFGDTGPIGAKSSPPVALGTLNATLFKACGIDFHKTYETEGRKAKYVPQHGSTAIQELF